MTNVNNSLTDAVSDAASTIGDAASRVGAAASQVKDKLSGLGQAAGEKLDESRLAAAKGLDRTASALHQGGESVSGIAHSAADKLSGTAKYLRKHDVKGMVPDVVRAVKGNPGLALLTAGIIGFLVGHTLARGGGSAKVSN